MHDQNQPQQPQGPWDSPQQPGQSQPPQYGQGQAPHGGAYNDGPPTKKKHTGRNIALGCLFLAILALGGCLAMTAGVFKAADDAVKEYENATAQRDIKEGAEVTVGDSTLMPGWKIGKDAFGYTVKGATIKNTSDQPTSAFITVKVYQGNTVLASIDCTTSELGPGEQTAANCLGDGKKFKKSWTKLTAEGL